MTPKGGRAEDPSHEQARPRAPAHLSFDKDADVCFKIFSRSCACRQKMEDQPRIGGLSLLSSRATNYLDYLEKY